MGLERSIDQVRVLQTFKVCKVGSIFLHTFFAYSGGQKGLPTTASKP
jgi:nickel-dependent lactate racemase